MSNGSEVCCILGVCCPAGSLAQSDALIHELQKQRPKLSPEQAAKKAARILAKHENFAAIAEILDDDA